MEQFGRLLLQRPGEPDQVFTLSKAAVTAGRAEINDIVLADAKVSRVHARFEAAGGGYAVADLGSGNGTWVDGVRVTQARLAPGSAVQLGDATFRFSLPDTAPTDDQNSLSAAISRDGLHMTLARTDLPRLTVVAPDGIWEAPLRLGRERGPMTRRTRRGSRASRCGLT